MGVVTLNPRGTPGLPAVRGPTGCRYWRKPRTSPALVTALQDHVKHELAPYKYPREVEFVTALPRTETGKIRRVELREREVQRKAPRSPGAAH